MFLCFAGWQAGNLGRIWVGRHLESKVSSGSGRISHICAGWTVCLICGGISSEYPMQIMDWALFRMFRQFRSSLWPSWVFPSSSGSSLVMML